MIESDIVAAGSINGVLSGKHYNRAVRSHKLVYEALQRLRIQAYLSSIPNSEAMELELKEIGTLLFENLAIDQIELVRGQKNFTNFVTSYHDYVAERCRRS